MRGVDLADPTKVTLPARREALDKLPMQGIVRDKLAQHISEDLAFHAKEPIVSQTITQVHARLLMQGTGRDKHHHSIVAWVS